MKNKETKKTYTLRVDLGLKVLIDIDAKNIQKAEDALYQMSLNQLLNGRIVDWEPESYMDFTKN